MLSGGSESQVIDGQVAEQHTTADAGSIYTVEWLKRSDLTEIALSDSSEATIWAEDTFNVDLSGGSMVYYRLGTTKSEAAGVVITSAGEKINLQ